MNTSRKEDDAQRIVVSSTEPTIVETQTTGGDRWYEVSGLDGVRVAVVIRHSGVREVVLFTEADDEALLTLSFTGAQACALALVLTRSSPASMKRATADMRFAGQRSARRLGLLP